MKGLIRLKRNPRWFLGAIASFLLSSAIAILIGNSSLHAAEKVVMKAGIFRASIPVSDLENFAQTGEISRPLRRVLNASKQDPEIAREALQREVPVNFLVLDRALNNPLGEVLLDKLGEVVHTRTDTANREALRSAFVLSATSDNKISLLEVIQNYPTEEVQVETDRLIEAAEQIRKFSDGIKKLLDRLPEINRPQ